MTRTLKIPSGTELTGLPTVYVTMQTFSKNVEHHRTSTIHTWAPGRHARIARTAAGMVLNQ